MDLFALRAMSHQPLHRLTRISGDPAGAWRRGDADVGTRALVHGAGGLGMQNHCVFTLEV